MLILKKSVKITVFAIKATYKHTFQLILHSLVGYHVIHNIPEIGQVCFNNKEMYLSKHVMYKSLCSGE
jgi:hypothetical protein